MTRVSTKPRTVTAGVNEDIACHLEILRDQLEGRNCPEHFLISYARAANIIRRHKDPITSAAQAKAICGIGNAIAAKIGKFLDQLKKDGKFPQDCVSVQNDAASAINRNNKNASSITHKSQFYNTVDDSQRKEPTKKKRKTTQNPSPVPSALQSNGPFFPGSQPNETNPVPQKRQYKPRYRSAPFALLLSLHLSSKENGNTEGMTKAELSISAQPYADELIIQKTYQNFYDGWSSMNKNLVQKGLVVPYGNPKRFRLTEEGSKIASYCEDLHNQMMKSFNTGNTTQQSTQHCTQQSTQKSAQQSPQQSTQQSPQQSDGIVNISDSQIILNSSDEAIATSLQDTGYELRQAREVIKALKQSSWKDKEISFARKVDSAIEHLCRIISPPTTDVMKEDDECDLFYCGKCGTGLREQEIHMHNKECVHEYSPGNNRTNSADSSAAPLLPAVGKSTDSKFSEYKIEILVIVDTRDTDGPKNQGKQEFYNRLEQSKDIILDLRRLAVGDAFFLCQVLDLVSGQVKEEYILDYLIERKRVADFRSTIRSSRHPRQVSSIKNSGISNLVYLIEGDMLGDPILVQEANRLFLDHKFTVIKTADTEQTIHFYRSIQKKLKARYSTMSWEHLEKTHKKFKEWDQEMRRLFRVITIEQTFIRQLLMVPGLGSLNAHHIVKKAKISCPRQLLDAFDACASESDKEKLVQTKGKEHNARRIGSKLSETIYRLFNWERYDAQ